MRTGDEEAAPTRPDRIAAARSGLPGARGGGAELGLSLSAGRAPQPSALIDALCVELEGRRFALPLAQVEEVLAAAAPTPLPESPPWVLGALDVRGEILPVLDVRRHLGLPPRPIREADHLILVWTGVRRVLVQVDRALDLYGIDPGRLRPIGAPHRPVRSAVGLEDGLLLVCDAELFLSDDEARAVEAALACAEGGRA